MVQLKIWHHRQKRIFYPNPLYRPAEKRSTLQNGQKNAGDQYPKLIFNLEDQYLLLLEDQYQIKAKIILILQEQEILILKMENEFGILISAFFGHFAECSFFQQAGREGSEQKHFLPIVPNFKLGHLG